MKYYYSYQTSIGEIWICEEDKQITRLSFKKPETGYEKKETKLLRETARQIDEYLHGQRMSFNLPLNPQGTPYQKTVWNALLRVYYGETRTYKQIAEDIGNPKSCRAVGLANNKNPIAIIIPCHRIVGSNGKLVGYAGGLEIKEKLLAIEQ
ncbi:MAG: methylated-DNA--[protein]-cysteine S-methyltransferase [Massilibacteroides sp.]|nr:methylated-DNA--[protein]-cysteine S-methyltransferase [Massilibacteroides sp.]MDD3062183.1 methylated-DNA--[protein]-cysteine S-methyltransferase [Massilibacteroides sp.]MDD4114342.1 methylated-DNA--[protein]-cysteine S-methyltransferase [Massilibacteroides sp.]MDD4659701.1 methylated-DNA--[protein]-cysteine S-methyltransferase [Massilibacteroides sp.]